MKGESKNKELKKERNSKLRGVFFGVFPKQDIRNSELNVLVKGTITVPVE